MYVPALTTQLYSFQRLPSRLGVCAAGCDPRRMNGAAEEPRPDDRGAGDGGGTWGKGKGKDKGDATLDRCGNCGVGANLRACGQCGAEAYCGESCQRVSAVGSGYARRRGAERSPCRPPPLPSTSTHPPHEPQEHWKGGCGGARVVFNIPSLSAWIVSIHSRMSTARSATPSVCASVLESRRLARRNVSASGVLYRARR